MYIIPIIVKTIKEESDHTIQQVWIFLERNGTHCISVGSLQEANEFLKINEIPCSKAPLISGPLIYAPVDSAADLSSFYVWSEVSLSQQPMKEVWRSFLWVRGSNSDEDIWGTNQFLKEISIAGSDSVHTVIGGYFKRS